MHILVLKKITYLEMTRFGGQIIGKVEGKEVEESRKELDFEALISTLVCN